jgi:hypothetical protein
LAAVLLQELEDSAREVAFEAAQRFASALAFGLFAGEVGGGLGVDAGLGDCDAVQGAVDLAVAAAVQAVPVGASGGCGDRRCGGARASLASV